MSSRPDDPNAVTGPLLGTPRQGYKCASCHQVLVPDDKVVVVREQAVTYDMTGLPRMMDTGQPLLFHDDHWHSGTFRTRFRVQARGKLGSLTPS